ncbi:gamma-glutamylcyclotransferase [Cohnella faecalis]|uniref:Gamma-glutamylcyclotransferase n=2 Tax=Cohnella faecalis TaxID=2315694 RepID=A0A398CR38_9BACL|nr:gamma-glutamylcyclotransferase [Cohnella faecalis]
MHTNGSQRLFIYGSLLPGLSNHGVIEPFWLACVPGSVRGRLVDVGEYPAVVQDDKHTVRGLWVDIRRAGLPVLDELEGFVGIEEANDYERVWMTDSADPALSGWVYVWADTRGYPWAGSECWVSVWARKNE